MPGPQDVVLRLSLNDAGRPIATPVDLDCDLGSEAACAWRSFKVTWVAEPSDRPWVVFFPDGTPFHQGWRMFGPGPARSWGQVVAPAGDPEYHYWILYVADDGSVKVADPKLVIQPSLRSLTTTEAISALDAGVEQTESDLDYVRSYAEFMLRVLREEAESPSATAESQ